MLSGLGTWVGKWGCMSSSPQCSKKNKIKYMTIASWQEYVLRNEFLLSLFHSLSKRLIDIQRIMTTTRIKISIYKVIYILEMTIGGKKVLIKCLFIIDSQVKYHGSRFSSENLFVSICIQDPINIKRQVTEMNCHGIIVIEYHFVVFFSFF